MNVTEHATSKQLSLLGAIEIPLTRGYTTVLDLVDSDLITLSWYVLITQSGQHYATRQVHKKAIYLHRLILSRMLGRDLLRTEEVDHINNNGLNNRRSNLRLASRAQNGRNLKMRRNNTSGYKGVHYDKTNRTWVAEITVNRKCIRIGRYKTPESAYDAYCKAAKQYHGEFANLGDKQ